MGLFSKLFPQKQPDSRQTQEQRAVPPKMTHWTGLDEEDAFEDQYGAKIDKVPTFSPVLALRVLCPPRRRRLCHESTS